MLTEPPVRDEVEGLRELLRSQGFDVPLRDSFKEPISLIGNWLVDAVRKSIDKEVKAHEQRYEALFSQAHRQLRENNPDEAEWRIFEKAGVEALSLLKRDSILKSVSTETSDELMSALDEYLDRATRTNIEPAIEERVSVLASWSSDVPDRQALVARETEFWNLVDSLQRFGVKLSKWRSIRDFVLFGEVSNGHPPTPQVELVSSTPNYADVRVRVYSETEAADWALTWSQSVKPALNESGFHASPRITGPRLDISAVRRAVQLRSQGHSYRRVSEILMEETGHRVDLPPRVVPLAMLVPRRSDPAFCLSRSVG